MYGSTEQRSPGFTFVTPEEGNELTRIEMRIDRLLQFDKALSHFDALPCGPNEAQDQRPRSPARVAAS